MLTIETFLGYLRDALEHLRDFDALRRNPLCALLGIADRLDAPAALQRLLVDEIEALEPEEGEPAHSRAWRIYELLFYRYVQQLSQQEVADQLGIGVRHERRERDVALETLAYHLWNQYDLEERRHEPMRADILGERAFDEASELNDELAWLKNAPLEGATDLIETLSSTLALTKGLAAQRDVVVDAEVPDRLPGVAVHPVALGELLLNVLTVAIHQASGGKVLLTVARIGFDIQVQILGTFERHLIPRSPNDVASLDIAGRLADLCGASLALAEDGPTFEATLIVPLFGQLPVLVLDDNPDTLQLLERYASGTRYRLYGTEDPAKVLSLAARLSPQVIVLDVMMPQVDGWKLLGQLREHPLSHNIPIVVCTILAQEELALTLGASGFVKKPVRRQAFLAALDQASQARRGSG
jgi:CheY-like chemotaxis protein